MARTTLPLTNTQVKQAKEKDKNYALSDGGGLELRVKTNGSKLWVLKYTHPITKKRTNISFGRYPDMSLAQARKKREEAKQLLVENIDPKQHRDNQLKREKEALSNTFQKYADKWLELKRQNVKPETAEKAYQNLGKHILPKLGSIAITDVKPRLVVEILEPVKANGSLETVKRLCRIINEVMRVAVASGAIEVNYLSDITKLFPAPKTQNMATIKPEELPELMHNLNHASITKTIRCLLEWQLHTMTRPIEAATTRWADIDLENEVWVVPAERMKMKKPHTVPLTQRTLELLKFLQSIRGGSEYLFPSHRTNGQHINSQSANMALKRMGFAGELVSHGLRSLASTTLNEHDFNPEIIESALAHVDKNEIRRAYNRAEYLVQRREMMEWWSNHIELAKYSNNKTSTKRSSV